MSSRDVLPPRSKGMSLGRAMSVVVAFGLLAAACTGGGDVEESDNTRPENPTGTTLSGTPPQTAPELVEPPSSLVDQYEWSVLSSGAGGFVTGAATSPDGSTLLMRTDVGGAYRWDPETRFWVQLLDFENVPNPKISDYAVESVAIDPNNSERIFMAVGSSSPDPTGRVLQSIDGGETWSSGDQIFRIDGNEHFRTNGERLAVSPGDPNQVWLGTRTEGLWVSSDGGTTFAQIPGIPGDSSEDQAAGVLFVITDASGQTVWAGVASAEGQNGIYRSTDAGATWSLFSETAGMPYDAEVASDGRLWVTEREPGRVLIIDGDSIVEAGPDRDRDWEKVAIDPTDPNHVLVGDRGIGDQLYRTRDGGENWNRMEVTTSCPSIQWLNDYQDGFLPTGSLLFDRADPGRVWIPEGFGVWTAVLDDSDNFDMQCETDGVEELVSNDVLGLPGGAVVTAHWDRPLFWHGGDSSAEAIQGPTTRFNSGWDLDASPADPNFVVATVGDQRFCCEDDGEAYQSGFSLDGGQSWEPFASYGNGHPEDLRFGNIAVSSSDTSNLVWLPTFNGPVHVSRDQGASWEPIILPGTEDDVGDNGVYRGGSHGQLFLNRKVLAADRIEPSTFYLYHQNNGIYRSTDGGTTWEQQASTDLPVGWTVGFFNATLLTSPTDAGHLIFTPGRLNEDDYPAFESRDGGNTWAAIPGTLAIQALGFGAPPPEGGQAGVYAYGMINGETGVYRSTDGFQSWQLLSQAPLGNYQAVKTIGGSPDEFGTVYVGFTGTSFMVGRFVPKDE